MTKFDALKYNQGGQVCFITVMPFGVINKISRVLVYGDKEPYGYQRAINPIHTQKIYKSIKANESVSPTSIVLGVNRSEFAACIHQVENGFKLDIDESKPIFRIVDGQHRLKGIEKAANENTTLNDYNLSVIIMIIEDDRRRVEVKLFSDINSKAKPIKMDLTILAMYNYDIIEKVQDFDISTHVAVKVAKSLNDGDSDNKLWKNAIKFDVNNPLTIGIIGFKTFYESILPICAALVDKNKQPDKETPFQEVLEFVKDNANSIASNLIGPCWNVVNHKWEECFKNNIRVLSDEEMDTYFIEDYYLQRTMGAKSINALICDYLKDNDNDIKRTIDRFSERIKVSKLNYNDWEVGGRFSGLSSESGVNKIKDLI